MNKSMFQKFKIEPMSRSDIKDHPYNPRKIDSKNRNRLKNNLKKKGLLMPPIFNKTTGKLISGHQRLSILDTLEKNQNYIVDVAVVELSEKEEREQMMFFNNQNAMGEWDTDILKDLFKDIDVKIDIEDTGFTLNDLNVIGLDLAEEKNELFSGDLLPEEEEAKKLSEQISGMRSEENNVGKIMKSTEQPPQKTYEEKKKELQDIKKEYRQSTSDQTDDRYLIITFNRNDEKRDFCKKIDLDADSRYILFDVFKNFLKG